MRVNVFAQHPCDRQILSTLIAVGIGPTPLLAKRPKGNFID